MHCPPRSYFIQRGMRAASRENLLPMGGRKLVVEHALDLVVGFLLDVLVSILLTVLLVVVLWLGMNVLVMVVVILGTPLFFLFRRSVRYVVAQGRFCHTDLSRAVWFAVRATLFNTL